MWWTVSFNIFLSRMEIKLMNTIFVRQRKQKFSHGIC
jgi:hypothetical protein